VYSLTFDPVTGVHFTLTMQGRRPPTDSEKKINYG
jgi:hypothetical protein